MPWFDVRSTTNNSSSSDSDVGGGCRNRRTKRKLHKLVERRADNGITSSSDHFVRKRYFLYALVLLGITICSIDIRRKPSFYSNMIRRNVNISSAYNYTGTSNTNSNNNNNDNNNNNKTVYLNNAAEEAFAKTQLFVTTFPGGFEADLPELLVKTLQFFWPHDKLFLTFVMDDTTYSNDDEQQTLIQRIKNLFHSSLQSNIDIRWNPRTNMTRFKEGYNIQQLVGLWADNFTETDAEYLAIVDDDTGFTKAVQAEDLFDPVTGKPHAVVQYPAFDNYELHYLNATNWVYGKAAYINAMTYFPVVVKRSHLHLMRQAVLKAHPEFDTFDQFFEVLSHGFERGFYSQFCILFEYLWWNHRDEYTWHMEGVDGHNSKRHQRRRPPITAEELLQPIHPIQPYVRGGSPADNGVTPQMVKPIPRIAAHISYYPGAMIGWYGKKIRVRDDLMRRGYCYSQPLAWPNQNHSNNATTTINIDFNDPSSSWKAKLEPNTTSGLVLERCGSLFDLHNDINIRGEFIFECREIWSQYDPQGARTAHFERARLNRPFLWWNETELQRLFGEPSNATATTAN